MRRGKRERIAVPDCDHSIPASSALCACGQYGRVAVVEAQKLDPQADPITGCMPVEASRVG